MKKRLLVAAAILLIAVTACTQYKIDWSGINTPPRQITDVEDLVTFLYSHSKDSAKLNLSIDPDSPEFDKYFPITINGNKTISGMIKFEKSFPWMRSSSDATARINTYGTNIFEVADDATLSIDGLEASVSSNAAEQIAAIVYVDRGTIIADSFTTPATVTGLSIGPNATASSITVTDSDIGNIVIDQSNTDSPDIFDKVTEGNNSTDAEITTGFDASTAEEFSDALVKYGRVRLTSDITIDNDDIGIDGGTTTALDFNEKYSIDLNGYTINSSVYWRLCPDSIVSFSNGSINMNVPYNEKNPLAASAIQLDNEAELYFDNIHYFSNVTGLFMMYQKSGMVIDIKNSEIKAGGYYGIGTNANTPPTSENLTLNVVNSTVTTSNNDVGKTEISSNGDNVGILFNVKGNITISNSTIIGDRQAIIARGGNYEISNSTFKVTEEGDDIPPHDKYLESNWGSGSETPSAAMVFGNRSTSYAYPTTAKLTNVTTIVPDIENVFDIYVYQADSTEDEDRSVSVSGTTTNDVKINENRNGAVVNINN